MARKAKSEQSGPLSAHEEATRKNIPTVEHQSVMDAAQQEPHPSSL